MRLSKKNQYSWLVVNLIINIKELKMNSLTGNYKIDKENVEDMYEHFPISLGILASEELCLIPFHFACIVLIHHLNKNYVCIVI